MTPVTLDGCADDRVTRVSLGKVFRRLWAGSTAANLADGVAFVAIPLVATSLTSNPTLIAGLDFVYALVRLLLVVPIGVLVDRLDHRMLLWTANVARGGVLLLVAAAFGLGLGSLPLLYLAIACIGALENVADNAAVSILPTIVDDEDLDRANGRITTAQLIADEFAGPPIGGFVFALAVALPIALTGGLYAAAGMLFLALPRRHRGHGSAADNDRPGFWRQAVEGATWTRRHRLLRGLALTTGLASIAYMMTFSILVLYSKDVLALSSTGYGIILALSALGGLAGSVLAAPLRRRFGYRWVIPASLALGSATMIGLFLTTNRYAATLLLAGYILHVTVWNICAVSLRQRLTPEGLRGRVNSMFKLAGLIGLLIGAGIAGPLAGIELAIPYGVAGLIFLPCVAYTAVLTRTQP